MKSTTYLSFLPLAAGHVDFDVATGTAGAKYSGGLVVPHGCSDGVSTTAVKVTIPDGVLSVKAEFIPGFNVSTTMRAVNPPVTIHGRSVNSTVDTVTWTGEVPGNVYIGFGLKMNLPSKVGMVYFKTNQICGGNSSDWTQVPGVDGAEKDLKYPAAAIEVLEAKVASEASSSSDVDDRVKKAQALGVGGLIVGILGMLLGAIGIAIASKKQNHEGVKK